MAAIPHWALSQQQAVVAVAVVTRQGPMVALVVAQVAHQLRAQQAVRQLLGKEITADLLQVAQANILQAVVVAHLQPGNPPQTILQTVVMVVQVYQAQSAEVHKPMRVGVAALV